MRLLNQREGACNALAGPLTGSAHCALLRVVMRLARLPRNRALALNSEATEGAAPPVHTRKHLPEPVDCGSAGRGSRTAACVGSRSRGPGNPGNDPHAPWPMGGARM
jgi:hypothetical protein